MTVSATIAGLWPIMLGGDASSEIMRRIAAPMIGGMTRSTPLALLVVPVVHYLWKRASLAKGRR